MNMWQIVAPKHQKYVRRNIAKQYFSPVAFVNVQSVYNQLVIYLRGRVQYHNIALLL